MNLNQSLFFYREKKNAESIKLLSCKVQRKTHIILSERNSVSYASNNQLTNSSIKRANFYDTITIVWSCLSNESVISADWKSRECRMCGRHLKINLKIYDAFNLKVKIQIKNFAQYSHCVDRTTSGIFRCGGLNNWNKSIVQDSVVEYSWGRRNDTLIKGESKAKLSRRTNNLKKKNGTKEIS